jgi:hypothetical protein
MFAELFATSGETLFPVGSETINRANRLIAHIDSGRPIPPTVEKDAFIFRFLYYVRSFFFSRIRYEGEIVDFPGEMSEKLLESAADGTLDDDIGIFSKEFYSWVISSRVVVFTIDVAAYLLADEQRHHVAQLTSEIRAAWQSLNDESAKAHAPRERRVALVFTKMDVARLFESTDSGDVFDDQRLSKAALEAPIDGVIDVELSNYDKAVVDFKGILESDFEELISFFRRREKAFDTFFTSAYFKASGARFGVKELLAFLLPRRTY